MRNLLSVVIVAIAAGLGVGAALRLLPARSATLPDPAAVVVRVREVARLEALEVTLYKKVSFAPEPTPAGSLWGDLAGWLHHTFAAPQGKAIVFADAHVSLDLGKLDERAIRVAGKKVTVVRPPLRTVVELRPGDTEVIGSNLDSVQTAKMLELAKRAFEQEVSGDGRLRDKARASAERSIRGMLATLGFTEVVFVDTPGGELL